MVDPISNQQFSHDFQKFVLQDLSNIPLPPVGTPKIPFSFKTPKKNKGNFNKEKSPWELKDPKQQNPDKKSL